MPLLQQESKEQSRMPTGGGKPPTDSEAVNLRKCLFVGSTDCPNRTLCARVTPIPFTPQSKVGDCTMPCMCVIRSLPDPTRARARRFPPWHGGRVGTRVVGARAPAYAQSVSLSQTAAVRRVWSL